jgi:DnaJ homolog subfamily C member 19
MTRLLLAAGIICLLFKMITGRWPWQPKVSTRQQALFNARRLLGVAERASREEIMVAHRRVVTMVHPDKGGTNQQVHEANAARDLLLDDITGQR